MALLKEMFLKYGVMKDGVICHMICASLAGFNAVCIASPVDVMKNRMMNAQQGTYSSPVDCFRQTYKELGVKGFY